MNKVDPMIQTKLNPPFTRAELVPRLRLQGQVTHGLRGPLTLITAPAGFGKTTLAASCIIDCGMPVAWLSLDRDDDQPGRFMGYLIAAIQKADPAIGRQAAQRLSEPQGGQPQAVMASLINDLQGANTAIALVLDDYQVISSPVVHEQMGFLLEHCPHTLHLVIVTRSDPPLPVARLRARGQMTELRAADLRFSESEAAQLLNGIMGLQIDPESIARLEERTEGWIAGLQMAALSMRNREDIFGFIEAFSGTNRYIMDYLLEEALASQPPGIQHFLLHTSILERLTAPLCDFLLAAGEFPKSGGVGKPDADPQLDPQSADILAHLERENLFLVSLDDERVWYRYHHLFADLLRMQLQKSFGETAVAELHSRAAEWHGRNGSVVDAIHHASMASDAEMVERFIKQNYIEMVSRGEMSRIRFWIGNLSRDLVYSRPWLCIYGAYSHAWFGELDEAIRLLEEAEKRFQAETPPPEAFSIQGHLAYVKSRITAMRGDLQRAIELCLKARQDIPAGNLALQLDTLITLGYEYFLSGDFTKASQNLNEMIRIGTTAGAVINTVAASCVMARLYAIQGRLHQSHEIYQTAARLIPDEGGQHLGASALVEVGLADLLCEWNDLEAALDHLREGLALISMWNKPDDLALAYLTLARIRSAQSNQNGALEAVEKAAQLIQTRGVFSEARHAVEAARVRLWLATGDINAANRWAASQKDRLSPGDLSKFENELIYISQARVMLAVNQFNQALDLLSALEHNAQSGGRHGQVIEILMLKALGMVSMGGSEQAGVALTRCLALAEPQGYARIFLDEGPQLQELVAQWLSSADPGPLRSYASRLLEQFEAEPRETAAARVRTFAISDPLVISEQVLVEPLSSRELEVLRLIAQGKTNQEIAQQLVVARGTIKAHAASIYRKLEVTNRTEAAARARELRILS